MTLLQVEGLSKSFGGNRAVHDVRLSVAPGQLVALIGPNGAGKSTLFNLLGGQLLPDAGGAKFNGQALSGRSPQAVSRMGIGRTFQIPEAFASLTVLENVQMALIAHQRKHFHFWGSARAQAPAPAHALLDQVGLAPLATSACSALSYGDIKRLELAMALANTPRLLLMDEPTAGMAPQERHALMALVRQLVNQTGVAVLFTEHSMDVVFEFADAIVVLARGQVIANDTPNAVRANAKVQAVYFGTPQEANP